MIKRTLLYLFAFAFLIQNIFAQNEENIIKEVFDRFSKSPFTSIYSSGGAFYSGDDVDQMPLLINYYMNGTSKYISAVDGLFGGAIMNAQVIKNQLTLNVPEEPIKDNFNNFFIRMFVFIIFSPLSANKNKN